MGFVRVLGLAALAWLCWAEAAQAQQALPCGRFTQDQLPAPEPREAAAPRKRFEQINAAVKTQPYRVLFFGDSLTERFETWDAPEVWRQHMASRGVLNAGINGDRTEHVRWRLDHGNLAGPPPQAAVLWIGTNDLGHDRSAEFTAEGVRADLAMLRPR